MSLLRAAWQLVTARFVLLQAGVGLLAFVLFAGWLRVPDATVAEVVLSALVAVVLVAGVCGSEAVLLLRLAGTGATRRAVTAGAAAVLAASLLLVPLSLLLARGSAGDALRAGYLNSQLPAGLRHVFSYSHVLTLLDQGWDSLFWAGAIVCAMGAVAVTVARWPLRALGRMVGSFTAWVVLTVATVAGSEGTLLLVGWMPRWVVRSGLGVQGTSVAVRLMAVVVLDVLLFCISVALLVAVAQRSDADRNVAGCDGDSRR